VCPAKKERPRKAFPKRLRSPHNQDRDVVGLRLTLRVTVEFCRQFADHRFGAQTPRYADNLKNTFFSKHFAGRIFGFRESVRIADDEIARTDFSRTALELGKVKGPNDHAVRWQFFHGPARRTVQISGGVTGADKSAARARCEFHG